MFWNQLTFLLGYFIIEYRYEDKTLRRIDLNHRQFAICTGGGLPALRRNEKTDSGRKKNQKKELESLPIKALPKEL
jgi:hypothetical protein